MTILIKVLYSLINLSLVAISNNGLFKDDIKIINLYFSPYFGRISRRGWAAAEHGQPRYIYLSIYPRRPGRPPGQRPFGSTEGPCQLANPPAPQPPPPTGEPPGHRPHTPRAPRQLASLPAAHDGGMAPGAPGLQAFGGPLPRISTLQYQNVPVNCPIP